MFDCCIKNQHNADPAYHNQYTSDMISTKSDIRRTITFRDYKGFKRIDDIREHYKFFQTLGKGSFGEVKKAENIKGKYQCAVKIVKKAAIQ